MKAALYFTPVIMMVKWPPVVVVNFTVLVKVIRSMLGANFVLQPVPVPCSETVNVGVELTCAVCLVVSVTDGVP